MNPGKLRLLHLQDQNNAVGETMAAERGRFTALADPSAAPRVVSAFNLFQTPEPLAEQMADLLGDLTGGARVLEPSAGLGRLLRGVRRSHDGPVVLVEQSPECCRELYALTADDTQTTLLQGDFLTKTSAELVGPFDAVVMNPPFKQGRDIKHIRHAFGMITPGGRLVALCANGPRQRRQLQPNADQWHELAPDTFASEGTRVAVALLVMDK